VDRFFRAFVHVDRCSGVRDSFWRWVILSWESFVGSLFGSAFRAGVIIRWIILCRSLGHSFRGSHSLARSLRFSLVVSGIWASLPFC
jgi:hypothetical protein